jgi:hypothetical protein
MTSIHASDYYEPVCYYISKFYNCSSIPMELQRTSNVSVILRETPQRFGIKSDTHTTTFVLHVLQCHILKVANV